MDINGLHILQALSWAVPVVILFLILRALHLRVMRNRVRDAGVKLYALREQKRRVEEDLAGFTETLTALDDDADKAVSVYEEQGRKAGARILTQTAEIVEMLETRARKHFNRLILREKGNLRRRIVKEPFAKITDGKIPENDATRRQN